MADQKPTKKDFVDLINTVMGQKVMTEDQLTNFLDDAKKVNDSRGTEGLIEYIQGVTHAPGSKNQLKDLADVIQKSGDPNKAIDYLKKEKLLSEDQTRKINRAFSDVKKKKKK